MKLYQILLRKFGLWSDEKPPEPDALDQPGAEQPVYNPIGCRIGSVVKIDAIDLRQHRFTVKAVHEYSVAVGGRTVKIVDYDLVSRPAAGQGLQGRLRLLPDESDAKKFKVLFVTLYDSLAFDEGFKEVLNDGSNKFVVDDDKNDDDPSNDEHSEFWRVNDVGSPYQAEVKTFADSDGDGRVSAQEVSTLSVEFWDYSRMTDADGVEVEEFLIVEMDRTNGWFSLWRGSEVQADRVDVV